MMSCPSAGREDDVNGADDAATATAGGSSSPTTVTPGTAIATAGTIAPPPPSSSSELRMRTSAATTGGGRRRRRFPRPDDSSNSSTSRDVVRDDKRSGVRRNMIVADSNSSDENLRWRRRRRSRRLKRTKLLFNVVVAASAVCLTYWIAAKRRRPAVTSESSSSRQRNGRLVQHPHPRIVVAASASLSAIVDVNHHPPEVMMISNSGGRVLIVEPPPWDPNSSEDYHDMDRREHPPDGCRWMHHWQSATLTTCNLVHEQRILGFDYNKMLGQGGFRDGWRLRMGIHTDGHEEEDEDEDDEVVVLKTLRWNYESHSNWYMERYYEMHRIDAAVSDKLTWSNNVVDIYGNCGTSGLYEFAHLGDLQNYLRRYQVDGWERLSLAHQVALSVADLHDPDGNIDGGERRPAFAHNDLSMGQFVITEDFHVKIHDFNCARLFTVRSDDHDELCPVGRGNRSYFGAEYFRSPEELTTGLVTERVDLYSMGNVFYVLLTDGMHPYDDVDRDTGMDMIRNGIPPHLPEELEGSVDLVDVALRKAMDMCRSYDPLERSTAAEVASYFGDALAELEMRMDGQEGDDGEEDASSEDAADHDGYHEE